MSQTEAAKVFKQQVRDAAIRHKIEQKVEDPDNSWCVFMLRQTEEGPLVESCWSVAEFFLSADAPSGFGISMRMRYNADMRLLMYAAPKGATPTEAANAFDNKPLAERLAIYLTQARRDV